MWKTFDKKTKEKWLKIAREHQEADRFVQWKFIQDNETIDWMHRGCFFGCMLQTEEDVLDTASKEMKIPEWIVHLSDKIFGWLPKEEAVLRPVQLLEAIPTNKDTEKAWKRFMKRILLDEKYWAIAHAGSEDNVIPAIQKCAELYDMDVIDYESTRAATAAATAAARSAWSARAAAWAATAAWSARAATAATAADWAARAARDAKNRYQRLRDVIIEELQR